MVTQTRPKENRTVFYPLTNEDVVVTSQGMTPAQQRVFFYLKTLTGPWTDREVEVRICDLARDLRMDRSTVSRALRYLRDQGMIDVRALVVGIRIRAANCEDCDRHAPDAIATHTPHI